jgi:4-hydroxy-3-methylbut-2-enyl diphosphate reductase
LLRRFAPRKDEPKAYNHFRHLKYIYGTIAAECDKMLVIGAPNSSNSLRLAEVAQRMGVPSRLIERASDIDWEWLGSPATLGLTAGASAPELLVREVVEALNARFQVTEEQADHSPERMIFKLPRELVA